MSIFVDRVHKLPRVWSNKELRKFSILFEGKIVNVSGWKDVDKEGNHYRDYFSGAESYTITNYKADARGYQGYENEIFLDLEEDLAANLHYAYDVVFNHTTVLYQSFNSNKWSSVYTFTIASRDPEKWSDKFTWTYSPVDPHGKGSEAYIGCHAIPRMFSKIGLLAKRIAKL